MTRLVLPFSELSRGDVAIVGGKNASLGEMIRNLRAQGIRVPAGFATTADAYREFLRANDLEDAITEDLEELSSGRAELSAVGERIRGRILEGELPESLAAAIGRAYRELAEDAGTGEADLPVAVRSSATAEDLPEASFAGQLETFLDVRGEDALRDACRRCFASLFTDRAISYRQDKGFEQLGLALSVGVQRMVRSDLAGAGVLFTLDTETGFPDVVLINASVGLGETVVQGSVDPDEYHVFEPLLANEDVAPIVHKKRGAKEHKMVYGASPEEPTRLVETPDDERLAFVLDDDEILRLARWACAIEEHYGQPMDVEWAKDGETGEIFVVQARPETVESRRTSDALRSYRLGEHGAALVTGLAIGRAIAAGPVRRLDSPDQADQVEQGDVLVTGRTDPDWVPAMRRAGAVVTDHGGRTSHAAIVSRELGVPAVVGCGDATAVLEEGAEVTVSCAEGDEGRVYEGEAEFEVEDVDVSEVPPTRTQIMVNVANPAESYRWWRLPIDGVGLARMEFLVGNVIRVHPMALVHPDRVEDPRDRARIEELTAGWADGAEYFVDLLSRGIARIAAAHWPRTVLVRTSDFKTNEYARLVGGAAFEPHEDNPMLGWRGTSRYDDEGYRAGFELECRAFRRAREELGFENVAIMLPFCRTIGEADRVLALMADQGLVRGVRGLAIHIMCEVPSNVILAERFAERFDGFSIGTNDLTQLVLGVDRDNDRLEHLFDARDDAVEAFLADFLARTRRVGAKVGLCGQAPSDHPEFARFLVEHGIDSISVTPDSFLRVKDVVARAEADR